MNKSILNIDIEIKEANNFWTKLIGLSFKKNINYGLLFRNTNGIHTFFMRKPIDVVLFDKDFNIIKKYYGIKPLKIILPKRNVKHTLELPTGYLK